MTNRRRFLASLLALPLASTSSTSIVPDDLEKKTIRAQLVTGNEVVRCAAQPGKSTAVNMELRRLIEKRRRYMLAYGWRGE